MYLTARATSDLLLAATSVPSVTTDSRPQRRPDHEPLSQCCPVSTKSRSPGGAHGNHKTRKRTSAAPNLPPPNQGGPQEGSQLVISFGLDHAYTQPTQPTQPMGIRLPPRRWAVPNAWRYGHDGCRHAFSSISVASGMIPMGGTLGYDEDGRRKMGRRAGVFGYLR